MMLAINGAINDRELWRLHVVGAAFLSVTIMQFAANYVQLVYMAKVGQGILFSLRIGMFNHIQSLSPSFFHRTPVGRIMSRSQSDVLQLQETFELMIQSMSDILSLGGIVAVMLIIDWRLALVSLSILPVLFLVLGYWQRFARQSFMRIRRAIAMVNGEYNQNITGVRVVESFNRQDRNLEHFERSEPGAPGRESGGQPLLRRAAAVGGDSNRRRYGIRCDLGGGHHGQGRAGGMGRPGGLRPLDPAVFRAGSPPDYAVQPVTAGHGRGSADL